MGLFDLASPLLGTVDAYLSALPAVARVGLWGALSGWLSMWLYARLSRQEALADLKARIRDAQGKLNRFDGELAEMWPLMRHTLGLSLRHLGLALGPALLAGIPVIFVIVWISNAYGFEAPAPGEALPLELTPAPPEMVFEPDLVTPGEPGGYALRWPGDRLVARGGDGATLFVLEASRPTRVLHARQWWNWLIANPGGYLPPQSPLERVRIDLPARRLHSVGPAWLQGWPAPYFLLLVVVALGYKIVRRVH